MVHRAVDLNPSVIEILNAQADLLTLRRFTSIEILFFFFFFWWERIGGFIVGDVHFGVFLMDILVHGEILIISGHFFAIRSM